MPPRVSPSSTIKHQLVRIILLTSLAVLSVTCTALMIFEIVSSREATVKSLSTIADVVAENCSAALIFDDQKLAQEILSGLRVEPDIMRAALFNAEGRLVASHPKEAETKDFLPPGGKEIVRHLNDLSISRPVMQGNRHVGTVFIAGTFAGTYRRLGIYGLVVLTVMGCSILLALLLSNFFQRVISAPLLDLAKIAREVSDQNYAVRATKVSNDELGDLTEAFNVMLDHIQGAHTAIQESEERFRNLADNMAQLAWMADELGSGIWYNKRWYDYTGTTLEEMKGRGWEKVQHPDHLARVTKYLQECLVAGRVWEDTFPLLGRDGHYRWFLSRAVPIRTGDGTVVRWFGTNTDVTELRLGEEAVMRARDEALQAARAKDDFLAALSHELRTPLSPVLLLASDSAQNPAFPAEAREHFEIIQKNVALEARLIDDLLDLTSITRGKLILSRSVVSIPTLIGDALHTVEPEIKTKNLAVSLALEAGEPKVMGDPIRLQQVLWNVLKNAAKFTPLGGQIAIRSRVIAEPREVEIEIQDTGIGMTADEAGRVFEAFSQGDHALANSAHRFGGLGLGLAISRSIVELHAGRIRVESRGRDQGASFFINLPLAPAGVDQVVKPSSTPVRHIPRTRTPFSRRLRILLVEDHAPTRAALAALLKSRNFEVVSASSLAEARAAAAAGEFQLLISDIGLPDGNGHELMRELRTKHALVGIALTGYGMEEDIGQTLAAGFMLHLTKPVQINALEDAITQVLSHLDEKAVRPQG